MPTLIDLRSSRTSGTLTTHARSCPCSKGTRPKNGSEEGAPVGVRTPHAGAVPRPLIHPPGGAATPDPVLYRRDLNATTLQLKRVSRSDGDMLKPGTVVLVVKKGGLDLPRGG